LVLVVFANGTTDLARNEPGALSTGAVAMHARTMTRDAEQIGSPNLCLLRRLRDREAELAPRRCVEISDTLARALSSASSARYVMSDAAQCMHTQKASVSFILPER
jgi:hypothetical protein